MLKKWKNPLSVRTVDSPSSSIPAKYGALPFWSGIPFFLRKRTENPTSAAVAGKKVIPDRFRYRQAVDKNAKTADISTYHLWFSRIL